MIGPPNNFFACGRSCIFIYILLCISFYYYYSDNRLYFEADRNLSILYFELYLL